jgi:cob(I)alamin adenosyltransferase
LKIYTKTGDKGQTSLLTGKRVEKYHPRIEAYGTIDELNSFIGLLGAYDIAESDKLFLQNIQRKLFITGSLLAMDEKKEGHGLEDVKDSDIIEVEQEMDRLSEILPKLKLFIIPGGSHAIATAHVCRTICRRAERICVYLSENGHVDSNILIYLNRLSDYFFMLSRKIAFDQKITPPIWTGREK